MCLKTVQGIYIFRTLRYLEDKMGIKQLIDRNLFVSDFARKVICASYNKRMTEFIEEISQIDSIEDYKGFKKALNKLPPQTYGSTYSLKRVYAENTLYGYAYNVMKYAGIENENMLYLPLLEHGVDLCEELDTMRYSLGRSYIFQGNNKVEKFIRNYKQDAYAIGPFIHYVEDYYSEEKLNSIRKKMGKTLLVFPHHSTEYGRGDYLVNDFFDRLFKIASDYNTIIASVFWIDTNDSCIDYLQSRGVTLVSAGFKLDNQFSTRMKAIIKLADTVVFPTLTTSIGYAYYMGKKVICIPSERNESSTSNENQKLLTDENEKFVNQFCTIFNENADRKNETADKLIDYYWGTSLIKSSAQIKDIYYKSRKSIMKKLGF